MYLPREHGFARAALPKDQDGNIEPGHGVHAPHEGPHGRTLIDESGIRLRACASPAAFPSLPLLLDPPGKGRGGKGKGKNGPQADGDCRTQFRQKIRDGVQLGRLLQKGTVQRGKYSVVQHQGKGHGCGQARLHERMRHRLGKAAGQIGDDNRLAPGYGSSGDGIRGVCGTHRRQGADYRAFSRCEIGQHAAGRVIQIDHQPIEFEHGGQFLGKNLEEGGAGNIRAQSAQEALCDAFRLSVKILCLHGMNPSSVWTFQAGTGRSPADLHRQPAGAWRPCLYPHMDFMYEPQTACNLSHVSTQLSFHEFFSDKKQDCYQIYIMNWHRPNVHISSLMPINGHIYKK